MTRLVLIVLACLALCAGAGGVYGWTLFNRALPDYQGTATLRGLGQPVRVLRDTHGVPHIFAETATDAARALGYVHAGERFYQMEMQRRAGQGRLAEVAGADLLGTDKLIRTLGLYGLATSSYDALSPEAQDRLNAYAQGVNGWLATHKDRLPVELKLLGIRDPEPWKPADTLVWGKLMALQLSKNMGLEKLRAHLVGRVTDAQAEVLFPWRPDGMPVTTQPLRSVPRDQTSAPGGVEQAMAGLERVTGLGHGASNEWVVAGARTVTGKPILANDPHLGLEAPILWYLARIVTPDGAVKGATVPGLPLVLLGQNDFIAWGFTTAGADTQDLFIETLADGRTDAYQTPRGIEPFETREETIHVKGAPDVHLTVRATRHGPVLSDIDPTLAALAGPDRVVALAFTGLGGRDRTAEALMRLNDTHSWNDFLHALQLYEAPTQNLVYADQEGNIGYIMPGLVPVRRAGDGAAPVSGADGRHDWIGMIPFTQLPRVYNPAAGYLFNANNRLVGPDYRYFLGFDWEEPYRSMRIQDFLMAMDRMDLDLSARMQADHVSMAARALLPALLRTAPDTPRLKQALDILRGWNAVMDKDQAAPLIFTAWMRAMQTLFFAEGLGDPLEEKGPFKAQALATIVNDEKGVWCPAPKADASDWPCDPQILKALDRAIQDLMQRFGSDMTRWRWGDAHRAVLRHKLFSHVPFLDRLSDLSVPSSGGFYTLDRGGSFTMEEPTPYARTHGGGFRAIYDLADPARSRFMIATGESGHIASPHYGDLVAAWNDVRAITLSGSEDDLRAAGAKTLRLEP